MISNVIDLNDTCNYYKLLTGHLDEDLIQRRLTDLNVINHMLSIISTCH